MFDRNSQLTQKLVTDTIGISNKEDILDTIAHNLKRGNFDTAKWLMETSQPNPNDIMVEDKNSRQFMEEKIKEQTEKINRQLRGLFVVYQNRDGTSISQPDIDQEKLHKMNRIWNYIVRPRK